jgi:hypothetical protein
VAELLALLALVLIRPGRRRRRDGPAQGGQSGTG